MDKRVSWQLGHIYGEEVNAIVWAQVLAWVQCEDRLGALWETTADIESHHQSVQLHKANRS